MKIEKQVKRKATWVIPIGALLQRYQEIEMLQKRGSILADVNKNQFKFFMDEYGAMVRELIEQLKPINEKYFETDNGLIVNGSKPREGVSVADYQQEIRDLVSVEVEYSM